MAALKEKLGDSLDRLAESIRADLVRVQELQLRATQEKQRLVREFEEQAKRIEAEAEQLKEQWQQTKAAAEAEGADERTRRERDRQREDEEYRYSRDRDRKKDQDAYEETKAARERALAEREATLQGREREVSELPQRLEEAVKQAREAVTTELISRHDQTVRELKQRQEHETALGELKLSSLTTALETKTNEAAILRQENADLAKQLKEMARSAIEGRPTPPTSLVQR